MKHLFKTTPIVMILVLLAFSCEVSDKQVSPLPESTRRIIESEQFKALNVDPSSLDLSTEPTTQLANFGKAVILKFKNTNSYQRIIGFISKTNNEIIDVMLLKVDGSNDAEEFASAYRNGTFNGTFVMTTSKSIISLEFEKSKVKNAGKTPQGNFVEDSSCSDMRAMYQCIAATIDSMPTAAWVMCLAELPVCMAVCGVDCALQGCPWGGTTGNQS